MASFASANPRQVLSQLGDWGEILEDASETASTLSKRVIPLIRKRPASALLAAAGLGALALRRPILGSLLILGAGIAFGAGTGGLYRKR